MHSNDTQLALPPGQRAIDAFPRFGTHLADPAPAVPADPVIEVRGAVAEPFAFTLAELGKLPRAELEADFHCVAGWSAPRLHWSGVAFETFYRTVLGPRARPSASVTHVVFGGLDGYFSVAFLEDVLGEDVLIADHLSSHPLTGDHGAPARLVSPHQYGYISTKHLCRIELHVGNPNRAPSSRALRLLMPHPRARVWEEERHGLLPSWSVRHPYRLIGRLIRTPIVRTVVSGVRRL